MKILNTDPRKRYGIRQIRNHPWMKSVVCKDINRTKSEEDLDKKSEDKNNDLINLENVSTKLKTTKNVGEISKSFINTLNTHSPIWEFDTNLSKSNKCSPISSEEYSNFISCHFKNQFYETATNFIHSKRADKSKFLNNLTLDVPKTPEASTDSCKTGLPQICNNSRWVNNVTINSNKDNSLYLTANDSESTNVPKNNNEVSFTSQDTKVFIKSKLKYFDFFLLSQEFYAYVNTNPLCYKNA